MTRYSFEITGRIEIQQERYVQELIEQSLSEPRLLGLRRTLGPNSREDISREQAEKIIDAELFELLRSFEGSIASNIQTSLNRERWRERSLMRLEEEDRFQVSIRFSRGSLLYTLIVTFSETIGPMVAKSGLASLVIAAVEPLVLTQIREVCHATQSITTYVRNVVERSIAEPVAGPPVVWADDKLRDLADRVQRLSEKLDATRTYRQVRALALVFLGLLMANIVAVAAIGRKVGLF